MFDLVLKSLLCLSIGDLRRESNLVFLDVDVFFDSFWLSCVNDFSWFGEV